MSVVALPLLHDAACCAAPVLVRGTASAVCFVCLVAVFACVLLTNIMLQVHYFLLIEQ